MVVLRNGDWVLPYWREKGKCQTTAKAYAGVLISEDKGLTTDLQLFVPTRECSARPHHLSIP
eukprot:3557779-Pyramimonas_sp.AAC.1